MRRVIANGSWIGPWVSERTDCDLPDRTASLAEITSDGKIAAGILYTSYTGKSVVGTIAIDSPISKTFLQMIFDYPFNQLGVTSFICYIAADNEKSIQFVEKLGFTRVATIADVYDEGSMHIYQMWKKTCRWIGGTQNRKEI